MNDQSQTEPTFLATLADTGIDYFGIVQRPRWAAPAFDADKAWGEVEKRFRLERKQPVKGVRPSPPRRQGKR